MQVVHLEAISGKVFKPKKLSLNGQLKPSELLQKTDKFLIATKMCDGTFHSVFSEVTEILGKNRELILKGHINGPIKLLSPPDETVHGQRFLIFNHADGAYLLGDVTTALKKLSSR